MLPRKRTEPHITIATLVTQDLNTVTLVITTCGSSISHKRHQSIIWPKFAENCMKMKKIGLGACPKFYYVGPPLITFLSVQILLGYSCVFLPQNKFKVLISFSFHNRLAFCGNDCSDVDMNHHSANCWYSRPIGLAGEYSQLLEWGENSQSLAVLKRLDNAWYQCKSWYKTLKFVYAQDQR